MRRLLTHLLAPLLVLVACVACSGRSNDGLAWQAFTYSGSPVVLVHPTSHQCGARTASSIRGDTVLISVTRHDPPAGAGSCPNPDASLTQMLAEPLGSRSVQAARSSSPGTVFNLGQRLHQPIHDLSGLPSGAQADTSNTMIWTLTYLGPHGITRLYSQPATTTSTSTEAGVVRGHPLLAGCNGTVCWIENNIRYQIDEYAPGASIAQLRTAAIHFANTLTAA